MAAKRQRMMAVEDLHHDPTLQPRLKLDDEVVQRYAECMALGDQFPELDVIKLEGKWFVLNGRHRVEAAKIARDANKRLITKLPVKVHKGDRADALAIAAQANLTHGAPLTSDERKRAVKMYLQARPKATDTEISRAMHTTMRTVAKYREEVARDTGKPVERERTRKDGSTYTVRSRPPADDPKAARDRAPQTADCQPPASRPSAKASNAGHTKPSVDAAGRILCKLKRPITADGLIDVWRRRRELWEFRDEVDRLQEILTDKFRAGDRLFRRAAILNGKIVSALEEISDSLRDCEPFTTCECCGGLGDGCKACNETGFMVEEEFTKWQASEGLPEKDRAPKLTPAQKRAAQKFAVQKG